MLYHNNIQQQIEKRILNQNRHAMHVVMFGMVTCLFVGISFIWAYYPDSNLRDWSKREAFLQIRRREKLGLPYIDPNLIDPAKVALTLPSDEELGETEIII